MSDWRDDPATDRQREFAQDLGISIPPDSTKGEASDLITEAEEQRRGTLKSNQIVFSDKHLLGSIVLDKIAGFISIISWVIGGIIGIIGIIFLAQSKVLCSIVALCITAIVIFAGTLWKRKRNGRTIFSGGLSKFKPEPVHALLGTFDESFFRNPKTGKFQFPKYKHDNKFLIKITDNTDYRDEYWDGLDAEERREYTLEDFENDFSGPDLEVDSFDTLFYKPSTSHLKPLEYLKGHWNVVESLMSCEDNEWLAIKQDSKPMKILLEEGYLFERVISTDEDKLYYFRSFNVTDLRSACKDVNVNPGKTKQEIIDRMIESKKIFNLPIAVVRAPKFEDWFNSLVRFYIEDIRSNSDRFHPLYIGDIWDCVQGQTSISAVEDAIDEVIQTKYWLDRLRM